MAALREWSQAPPDRAVALTCGAELKSRDKNRKAMRTLGVFLLWCLLLVFCWPLALLAVLVFPFVWLVALPFRLVGTVLEAALALVRAVVFLPARLLGHRG